MTVKTIVRNINRVSLYLFEDDTRLQASATEIAVGDPVQLIIGDLNDGNATIYTGVTAPEDWRGEKYLYVSGEWSLNPDYIEPNAEQPRA